MKKLSPDWFCDSPIDFEYKQFIVLDYLKDAHQSFKERTLYPYLSDINYQLQNLEKWKYEREFYIKKNIKGIDFEKMTFIYDTPECSEEIKEINEIVDYSIPEFRNVFKYGRKTFNKIEEELKWHIIGLIPNHKLEGFIFVRINNDVKCFKYTINPIYELKMELVKESEFGISVYDDLKREMAKMFNLPFPLTISIEIGNYPMEETILPLIQKSFVNKILGL